LASALSPRVFGRRFRIEDFCSSISIRLANQRVQFRRGASAVYALVCKLSGIAEIILDSRHIKPGSSIYDDKVTRSSRRFRLLPLKNSAAQLRVRLWTASAKSIEALRFQSELVGRNRA